MSCGKLFKNGIIFHLKKKKNKNQGLRLKTQKQRHMHGVIKYYYDECKWVVT